MAEIAEEMGVEFRLGKLLKKSLWKARPLWCSYRKDAYGRPCHCQRGLYWHMTSIVPNKARKRWTDKKLESKKYSCSTFMLYLGVDRTYDLPHHQIYASKNYVENLEDIEKHHRLSWDDPSVYVQNACVTDPDLAPEGCATVYVLVPVSHQTENIDWSKESSKFRERILDQIEPNLATKTSEITSLLRW